ncbi:hypothetical protein LTR15_007003 [Elasticomyces elasticus]|nr:hypothetical protein LTR15_007003 [Elasticomyces elasticus]
MAFNAFLLALFVGLSVAGYTLEDDYTAGGDFFDMFSFFTDADPTHGYVNYVDQSTATQNGYIDTSSDKIYIGTDAVNVTDSAGRNSVRLTSNKSYSSGLVILDLDHMPGGICGTWPAFWMVGPNWPSAGEIDIIEGVNSQASNAMTLHTGPGCSITDNNAFSGEISTDNCDVNAEGQDANAGCGIHTSDTESYGSGFNANNGGVYATNYDSSAISVYFFPRGSIPSDISSGSPNPSSWGKPLAQFQGGCDIGSKIVDQQIVFDLTFCGDWAGAVWSSDSTCSAKASTCNDFVQNNPSAFKDAYWSINSLKVYQSGGSTSSKVESTTAWAYSSSLSAAEPTSTSVWAASYSSSAIPTTFALSSKPVAPTPPLSLPVTPPYSSGNATDSPYPTGSGTAIVTAPVPSGTGSPPVASPTDISVSSSPPESSSVEVATSSESPTQTLNWQTRSWSHRHHYTPSPQAVRRHLRQHKRHGAGLL